MLMRVSVLSYVARASQRQAAISYRRPERIQASGDLMRGIGVVFADLSLGLSANRYSAKHRNSVLAFTITSLVSQWVPEKRGNLVLVDEIVP